VNFCRYYYAHRASNDPWPSWSGVKHGDEIDFTFGLPLNDPGEFMADELDLATDVVTYWTNFAKTG
jgi:carboxylesterase type B